jgi:histidinol dehydrogenase
MGIERLSVEEWRASPHARRRLDLGATPEQAAAVREICAHVAQDGDRALRALGVRFDGWQPDPGESFAVPPEELAGAIDRLTPEQQAALRLAADRIRRYHEVERFEPVQAVGALELRVRPVERAGLYVPGGRASYPSTVLMTAIPARVAGVREVVLATPPGADGRVPPAVLAAADLTGIDTVYRVGGAQAIAALAYGTETVARVDVVAGPGNVFVTLAKGEVFGQVGLDGVAGPTEIVVVADGTASAELVAADLVSQLEHDPLAFALLATDSAALADAVEEAIASELRTLERGDTVRAATCCLVVTESLDAALSIANEIAPEHLELLGEHAEQRLGAVANAGAVFVGPYAPVSLGDYVIGPNHTLPTSGAARFGSPLGVHTFLKRTSVARVDRTEFAELEEAARVLAEVEGFGAHARAIELRGLREGAKR